MYVTWQTMILTRDVGEVTICVRIARTYVTGKTHDHVETGDVKGFRNVFLTQKCMLNGKPMIMLRHMGLESPE